MPQSKIPNFFINAFYESKFKGQLFVVKAGGKVIEDKKARDSLIRNIRDLNMHGIKVLLIYGAGKAMDTAAQEKGLEVQKHEGRRITDEKNIALMKEVVSGHLSLSIYESMAACGAEGLSFNAVPFDWMEASLRPKDPVDFGYVGDIHAVHARPIHRLFKVTDFIACPCLTYAEEGMVCNINADTIATELAIGTGAGKLIFLSDVDGVEIGGETAFIITAEEVPGHVVDGSVSGGMQIKLENCARALKSGVKRIHLINGLRKDALKKEIYEPVGPGTMLIEEREREHYMNEIEAQKVIEAQGARA